MGCSLYNSILVFNSIRETYTLIPAFDLKLPDRHFPSAILSQLSYAWCYADHEQPMMLTMTGFLLWIIVVVLRVEGSSINQRPRNHCGAGNVNSQSNVHLVCTCFGLYPPPSARKPDEKKKKITTASVGSSYSPNRGISMMRALSVAEFTLMIHLKDLERLSTTFLISAVAELRRPSNLAFGGAPMLRRETMACWKCLKVSLSCAGSRRSPCHPRKYQ